jgi:hypothetical protein
MSELGHPDGLPELFLDRSLGRRQVPARLRERGLSLQTLAEVYGIPREEEIADVTWLRDAGHQGWVVLMKDDRIRYRSAERAVLLEAGVKAFCLANANLRAADMAEQFLAVIDEMVGCCRLPGPFLYVVSNQGLRAVTLRP